MNLLADTFRALLDRQAPVRDFVFWFNELPDPRPLDPAEWLSLAVPILNATSGFDWLTGGERGWIQRRISDFAKSAFTDCWREGAHDRETLRATLSPFIQWLQSLSDGGIGPLLLGLARL